MQVSSIFLSFIASVTVISSISSIKSTSFQKECDKDNWAFPIVTLKRSLWSDHTYASVRLKFIYSEKATKFCEISILLLSVCTVNQSKVEILQNFVAFSEYTNFTSISIDELVLLITVKK